MRYQKGARMKIEDLVTLREKAIKSDDIDFVKEVMILFSNSNINSDFDNEYYKSILDGSWPSSKEILLKSLNKN